MHYKFNLAAWMDDNDVDAVIYDGFLTSAGNNDAASAVMSSDSATGVLTSAAGMPTVVVPIGANGDGQCNAIHIMGRAWSDADVLGMGYALEEEAQAAALSAFAPALPFSGPADSVTTVSLGRTAAPYGSAVTATVTADSDPAATGPVSVEVAGRTLTGALSEVVVTVQLPARLPVGTHLVTASCAGSSTVAASEATTWLRVNRARPVVLGVLPRQTVSASTRAPFVIVLPAPAAADVTVQAGGWVLLTRRVPADGRVRVTLPRLAAGTYDLRARVLANESLTGAGSEPVRLLVWR